MEIIRAGIGKTFTSEEYKLRTARKQGGVHSLMRFTPLLRSYTQFVELPFHSGFVGRSPATLEKRIHIDSVRPI